MSTACRYRLLLCSVLLLVAPSLRADPVADGVAKLQNGDYLAARKMLEPYAAQGDPQAELSLATTYLQGIMHGENIEQNKLKVLEYTHAAAVHGLPKAQFAFAKLLSMGGMTVARNSAYAAVWMHRAADQGLSEAEVDLAMMYETGHGVPQDDVQAAYWYRRAADHGDAAAQYRLAFLYFYARGVPRDYAATVQWLQKAAASGQSQAQLLTGVLHLRGEFLPRDDAAAFRLLQRSAVQGDVYACFYLGLLYEQGRGVARDPHQAQIWYAKASDADYHNSQVAEQEDERHLRELGAGDVPALP